MCSMYVIHVILIIISSDNDARRRILVYGSPGNTTSVTRAYLSGLATKIAFGLRGEWDLLDPKLVLQS